MAPLISGSLVTTGELARQLDDPELRIADCRWYLGRPGAGRAAYDEGHIPGSFHVSLEDVLSAPRGPGRHPLPEADTFARSIGRLGIGPRSRVVGYDDAGGTIAARLWWMLRWIGHEDIGVLDGGWDTWTTEGRPTTTAAPAFPAVEYGAVGEHMPTWDRAAVRAGTDRILLLDARAPERYRGEVEPIDPVAGHIPTATNAPHADNLDVDKRMLSASDLRRRYESLGVVEGKETVVYCGSGVTACHDLLAMEIAGLPTAALYPGSWSDWSDAGDPVAVGPDPGTLPRSTPL
ncbi:MAG: sulfurtransferase [Acidimicrobiia bacterium]